MWEIPFLPAFLFLQLVEQKSSECELERRLDSGCPVAHALPRGRRAEHGRGLVTGRLRPTQMYARTHARTRLAPDNKRHGDMCFHMFHATATHTRISAAVAKSSRASIYTHAQHFTGCFCCFRGKKTGDFLPSAPADIMGGEDNRGEGIQTSATR